MNFLKRHWRTFFELFLIAMILGLLLQRQNSKTIPWHESIIHSIPTRERIVALTYDDGPSPVYTPQILDILDRYHVKATFFMIGREMEKYPDVVREVLARGHEIANHTYTHPANIELDTAAQIIRELHECQMSIDKMTGRKGRPGLMLFRPPRGLVDSTVFRIALEEGYQTVLWTVSADHHEATTPQMMADRVFKLNRPGGIILAHDGSMISRWKDVAATPLIIQGLKKRGFRFVTVSELLRKGAGLKIPRRPYWKKVLK